MNGNEDEDGSGHTAREGGENGSGNGDESRQVGGGEKEPGDLRSTTIVEVEGKTQERGGRQQVTSSYSRKKT